MNPNKLFLDKNSWVPNFRENTNDPTKIHILLLLCIKKKTEKKYCLTFLNVSYFKNVTFSDDWNVFLALKKQKYSRDWYSVKPNLKVPAICIQS